MRDCASANGDCMTTASKRECWGPTCKKQLFLLLKKKKGGNYFSGTYSF